MTSSTALQRKLNYKCQTIEKKAKINILKGLLTADNNILLLSLMPRKYPTVCTKLGTTLTKNQADWAANYKRNKRPGAVVPLVSEFDIEGCCHLPKKLAAAGKKRSGNITPTDL